MNFSLEMKEKFLIKFNIFEKYNAKKIMEEILIFDEDSIYFIFFSIFKIIK